MMDILVIAGATGDLSRTKLMPALVRLEKKGFLAGVKGIVGTGRNPLSRKEFQELFPGAGESFTSKLYYHQGYKGIKGWIKQEFHTDQALFFLSLPPGVYEETAKELHHEGFGKELRLVIEKPFGYDTGSSKKLNKTLTGFFKEDQIYRIDHYLAKEAIQNILVFRFTNTLFQPVWNNRYISSIQINATETSGIRNRGAYFDNAGILRDMVQNHLTQLLCLLTMEAPASLQPVDINAEKLSILKTLRVINCHRGQYEGYRKEKGVSPSSEKETWAELELAIDNFRWAGVPVFIRTGKAASRNGIEIGIEFKPQPKILYNKNGLLDPNRIIFKVQPHAGIIIDISSKLPGGDFHITNANMAFCYRDISGEKIPDAYLKLLMDAINGDRTLFVTAEETELAWSVYEDHLDKGPLTLYKNGEEPDSLYCRNRIDFSRYENYCTEQE
jgi:glucose-6-phosphate 1-dehydrogenase